MNQFNPVIQDFDIQNIVIKKPRILYNNTITCPVKYNKNQDLIIQSPLCYIPKIPNKNSKQILTTLLTTDYSYNENTKKFINNLLLINKIIQDSYKNITKLVNQHENNTFHNSININRQANNYYLNLTVQSKNQDMYINIYNSYNQSVNEDYIVEQSECYALLHLKNIWINENKYGLNWEIVQLKVYPPIYKLEQCFIYDSNIKKELYIQYKDDPIYKKFFKMKRIGVPIQNIQLEIKKENLDENVILKDENEYINSDSKGKGKGGGKGKLPPPPPPPPPSSTNIDSINKTVNLMDVLKDINTIKLKKAEIQDKPTINNNQDLRVPSLQDIVSGLKNLKKTKKT